MILRALFLIIPFILFTQNLVGQVNTKKLDRLFDALYEAGDFNGSVLVAHEGEVVYQRYLGFADYETQRPIDENTVFELASMGKQFTAMGIMILKEKGVLAYDDPVHKYLPKFPYRDVTLRHLLNMSAGIPDYLNFSDRWDDDQIATNADVLAFYYQEQPKLQSLPNTTFNYANVNYVILAEIISTISEMPFADFLQHHIFIPAGMRHTRSFSTRFSEGSTIQNYAYPYVKVGEAYLRTDLHEATKYVIAASGIEGDGSIVSTPLDLMRWTNGLQNNQFVSAATLAEAYTAPIFADGSRGEYGFGIYLGKEKVWHWGGWPGVQTAYTRYLSNNTVAIYL